MARRVSWTNNSSGHNGTYVYRAPTLDPQALPTPVATVEPVAQGATVEYVDTTGIGDQCYAVQDFEGESVSAVSAVYCFEGDPFTGAEVGDYIEGGVYAGTMTYEDLREFHIVFSIQSGELPAGSSSRWKIDRTETPDTQDLDDGKANTDAIVTAGISNHPAANHCVNYSNDGFDDFYLPSRNELALVDELVSSSHPEFSTDTANLRWTSTEESSNTATARARRFSNGEDMFNFKDSTGYLVRPCRRVAV